MYSVLGFQYTSTLFVTKTNKGFVLCIVESQRPPSRASDLPAAGGGSHLRSGAPAASRERKACRRPEKTRGTAALHHLPGRTDSGLPRRTEAQERLLL